MATTPTQSQIDQFIEDTYGGQKVKMNQTDVDKVKQQILSQGLTSKWKGQGFGSAEANALDMAKSLVASGVTDIKQIGQGTYYQPTAVTSRLVDKTTGQVPREVNGKYYVYLPNPNDPETPIQKEVDPQAVTKEFGLISSETSGGDNFGEGASTVDVFRPLTAEQQKQVKTDTNGNMTVPVATGQGIINKDTGERILSNYNERTTGNAFGGTYAGKGNTAYRVQFDDKGNPIFYTTEASSNDLLNILQSNPVLNVAANLAAAYFGGPAGTAALAAAQGKDVGDIAKAYALSYLGSEAGSYLSGSDAVVDVLGKTGAQIAGNAAKSYVTSEGKIDPVAALLSGGMDAGVGAIIGDIPGFANLDKGTQTLVTKAVSNTLRTGKLDPASLAQAAFKAGTSAMANATNTPTEAQFNAANADFLKTLEPYLSSNPTGQDNLIKAMTDAGLTPQDTANTDWASIYAEKTTNPVTGQTISGNDPSQIANQNLNIDQKQLDSYNQNLQKIIDSGGFTSQWQTSSGDRIMISDDGSGIGINQDGDPYALTKETVDQMVKNGQLNTADSGYVAATGGTGNTPGGSGTKTTTTSTTKTTPTTTTKTATPAAIAAAASWYGLNPADVVKMNNDVAHINPLEELFGGSIYDHTPAPSAQDQNAPEADVLKALEDTQNYAGGGDIHALLQLLRS